MAEDADERIAARRLAMDLLARREHSRQELERKLISREFSQGTVSQVLDALRAEGLQDDQRFVEAFVRSRVTRGKGPLKVMAELGERGIDMNMAEDALAESGADWASIAEAAIQKRFGGQPAIDFKDRARRLRFLAQRGFTREQSQAAVSSARDARAAVTDEET